MLEFFNLFGCALIITLILMVASRKSPPKYRMYDSVGAASMFVILYVACKVMNPLNPRQERAALPGNAVEIAKLEAGVYEYLDLWDTKPFHLLPLRKVVRNGSNVTQTDDPKRAKWILAVLSGEEARRYKIPAPRSQKKTPIGGTLEVKVENGHKCFSVIECR
ncbi:MAG: hypothetical protein ABI430_01905 [Candidatus Taylorbacteria bacterium]